MYAQLPFQFTTRRRSTVRPAAHTPPHGAARQRSTAKQRGQHRSRTATCRLVHSTTRGRRLAGVLSFNRNRSVASLAVTALDCWLWDRAFVSRPWSIGASTPQLPHGTRTPLLSRLWLFPKLLPPIVNKYIFQQGLKYWLKMIFKNTTYSIILKSS